MVRKFPTEHKAYDTLGCRSQLAARAPFHVLLAAAARNSRLPSVVRAPLSRRRLLEWLPSVVIGLKLFAPFDTEIPEKFLFNRITYLALKFGRDCLYDDPVYFVIM